MDKTWTKNRTIYVHPNIKKEVWGDEMNSLVLWIFSNWAYFIFIYRSQAQHIICLFVQYLRWLYAMCYPICPTNKHLILGMCWKMKYDFPSFSEMNSIFVHKLYRISQRKLLVIHDSKVFIPFRSIEKRLSCCSCFSCCYYCALYTVHHHQS